MINTVFFDLDGTLADTAPDLGHALNTLLVEQGRAPLSQNIIRPIASNGSPGLIKLGFGVTPEHHDYPALRARFLEIYNGNLCLHTKLFPGVAEVLAELGRRDIKWGVVTNKPAFLTEPLMKTLNPSPAPACIVSGDSTANRKPHPEPMLHACKCAGCAPLDCVYVGDAERDIQAGREAGMQTLVALFGYISKDDMPANWGADGMIRTPHELLDWLDAQ
jgi:N-acetyl-D-muramate 6-phosphate phosphatase